KITKPPANAGLEGSTTAAFFRQTNAGTKCNKQPARIGTPIHKIDGPALSTSFLPWHADHFFVDLFLTAKKFPRCRIEALRRGQFILQVVFVAIEKRYKGYVSHRFCAKNPLLIGRDEGHWKRSGLVALVHVVFSLISARSRQTTSDIP